MIEERFKRFKSRIESNAKKKLSETGKQIEQKAIDSIMEVSQGHQVMRRGKLHTVSRVGDAPNNDTGGLSDNISASEATKNSVSITSDAPYSIPLELVYDRPFMIPSLYSAKDTLLKDLAKQLKEAFK